MNVVIYARYSSHSQTEQSIEGQLHTCYEYAKNNSYLVVGEYIDRAQSGTTDSRAEFQRMIADSDKHTFEGVLVYQLDRFARNRYDSAINKAKLKKNGVRVISARENISDDASGILVEGVLESMAEYYSAELSQKIRRGMDINAEKCLSNGSNPGLGYRVDEERRFHVDPEGAAVVREIFERYASGETVAEIVQSLNARQIKTSLGKAFNKNSLHRLLRNRRYIGYYIYKGAETPNGMPRILDDELFERVQHILDRNKKAPARARGREEYLLTTKLFCGYCREMMTGYGGTGKSGKIYHYYACNNFKRRECKKKVISKDKIENRVVLECRKLLTDSNIERIAASVAAVCESDRDTASIKRIKAAIQEADTAIENLWKALEKGQAADMITERIEKRQKEKDELQAQLAIEMNKQVRLSAPDIRAYLYALKRGDKNDETTKRGIINIFLQAVYLYDDRFTLLLNGSDKPIVIDDILLDEIEEGLDDDLANHNLCSPLVADAPPGEPDKPFGLSGSFPYRRYNRRERKVGMSMKQTNRLKRAGAVFCAGALVLSLFPATLAAGSGPAESSNINKQNYSRWSSPVTSYLYANESGGLTRVEYTGGQVVVENYSASFAFLDSRTIQPELPIWGGFFAGESYNFLVFGQSNAAESDSTEVIRVVKYDKNWNRLGAASLKGARTTIPFDAGSLRCDEYGDYLYIRTCHEMYTSDDGLNHQANLTMAVRQSDMTITDSFYDVMNISLGYVSHSFNQFILVDEDGKILALDHGDAYPRSAVMVGYYSNASTGKFSGSGYDWCWNMDLQTFAGSIGDNTTGASVGGLEETTNGYVMTFNYDGVGGGGDRYVYFQYMDKATGKGKQYKLNNSAGSNTPVLAPTGMEGGYLLWNDKSGDTLNYVTYDASGVPGDGVQTAAAPLSDCQPIPYGDGVVWYVTENSVPTFYTLDASGVAAHPLGATEPETTPTPSATPSATPTPTPSATPSATPPPTPTPTPSATSTPTPVPMPTPSVTPTPTLTPTPSTTPTPTPTPSTTPTPTPTPTPVPNFFDDVPDAAWYADYVNLAAQAGLMKGVGNGRFNPSGIMSVAEVVTLTARLHAERNGKTVPAADGAWYQGAYTYCLQNGLFTASEVPLSTMGDSATRFQMADLMDRAVPESEKQAINSVPDGGVPDLRESDPYGDVVYRWYRAGITEGDQSGRFNGNSQISRAELATILCRLAGLTPRVGDKDLQPEPTPTPSQSVDYVAPELNFTTPVVSIYEHGTMLLTLVGADYRSISHDGITWVNESPDILTLDANRSRVTAKQVGVGYLTATKDGYTTRMTIHVVPSEDNIGMSTIGILMRPGNTATTELYVYSNTRFYGKDYTVEWSVDHPELLTLEEYTSSKGNPAVRFTTLQCGDAVITCRVTLPDGSYTEEYCCVAIRPKE